MSNEIFVRHYTTVNGEQVEDKRHFDSNGNVDWERAVPTTTSKAAMVSFRNTRKVDTNFGQTDVLSSLKAFGATPVKHKQPKLWSQYMPCDGITNASSTSIDTGIKAQSNMEIFVRVMAKTDSFYILQARETGTATIYGLSGSQTGNTITSFGLTSGITRTTGHIYTIKVTLDNGTITLYVKDETAGTEDTKTGTLTASYTFPSPTTMKLFGDASKITSGTTVYRAYIKVNGAMAWDMYPVVNVVDNNTVVAYNDMTHAASTMKSGSITGGELIQPISYAESDGTAYADTGVQGNLNTKAEITFKTSDATAYQAVFGARTSALTDDNIGVLVGPYEDATRVIVDFGNYENGRAADPNAVSTVLKYKAVSDKNGRYIYNAETGALIASNTNAVTASFTTTNSLRLFDMYGKSATAGLLKGNFYSAKIWDNSILVRDYLPVRIGTTVELLDLVSWQFATRTGTFTAGADIQIVPDVITVNTGDLKYGYPNNMLPPLTDWITGNNTGWKPFKVSDNHPTFPFTYYVSGTEAYTRIPIAVVEVEPSTTYTISTTLDVWIEGSEYGQLANVTNASLSLLIFGSNKSSPFTFTTTKNTHYLVLSFGAWGKPAPVVAQGTEDVVMQKGSSITKGIYTDGSHKLMVGGINLFDKTAVKSNCYLNSTGAEVYNTIWNVSDYMPVIGGETYYQRLRTPGNAPRTCWYDANKQFISAVEQKDGGKQTAPANAKYCKMCVIEQASPGTQDLGYAMFTKGSTAPTEYEPYITPLSRDIPMLLSADSFINTQADSNNKTETWAVKVLTGSNNEQWSYDSSGKFFYIALPDGRKPTSQPWTFFSNRYTIDSYNWVTYAEAVGELIAIGHTQTRLAVKALSFNGDIDAFKADLAANNLIILYPLATPEVTTVTIAPVELTEKVTHTVTAEAELPVTEQATYLGLGV